MKSRVEIPRVGAILVRGRGMQKLQDKVSIVKQRCFHKGPRGSKLALTPLNNPLVSLINESRSPS